MKTDLRANTLAFLPSFWYLSDTFRMEEKDQREILKKNLSVLISFQSQPSTIWPDEVIHWLIKFELIFDKLHIRWALGIQNEYEMFPSLKDPRV